MKKNMLSKILCGALCLAIVTACVSCGTQGQGQGGQGQNSSTNTQGQPSGSQQETKTDFPTKAITIVVGNSAGGGTDLTARVAAEYMPKYLGGVSVVVSNNPTGSGEAAWLEVANSNPDGYTLGVFNSGQIMATVLRDTQYQVENYRYIAQLTDDYRALAIRADDDRFSDFDGFTEYAKDHELLVGDSGTGSAEHFTTMAVSFYSGVDLTSVHTNGSSETKANLLGGHLDAISCAASEVVSLVNDGSVKIIAIGSADGRLSDYPDVPTFIEKGVNMHIPGIRGFYCPLDTPQEVIDILVDAMEKVTQDPEYIEAMNAISQPVINAFGQDCEDAVFGAKQSYLSLIETVGYQAQN